MKKLLAIFLASVMLLSSLCLLSCGKDDENELTPGGNETKEPSDNTGTIDNGENDGENENSEGKLNVGEDTEGDKWGEFIPYN